MVGADCCRDYKAYLRPLEQSAVAMRSGADNYRISIAHILSSELLTLDVEHLRKGLENPLNEWYSAINYNFHSV